jgi:membrane peptidoglycan carboxypeptidase
MPRRRRIPRLLKGKGASAPAEDAGVAVGPSPGEKPRRRTWLRVLSGVLVVLVLALAGVVLWEMRTSHLQARYLAPIAAELTWTLEDGPSSSLVIPGPGPYDLRLGYHQLPERVARAQERGFRVTEQARVSDRFRETVEEWDLFPIYPEKARAGLQVVDRDRNLIYDHHRPLEVYPSFESIPPVVWQTLLFVENRTALDPSQPYRNPAVEWGRLIRSTVDLGLRQLGREGRVAGASTLATQIEKFRHEQGGLTETPRDKLLQMASATFRAYLGGPETLPARRTIVLDYLNSVPLAAIRGEGEILGLAEGLRTWYGADVDRANLALSRVPVGTVGRIPEPTAILPPGAPPAYVFWLPDEPEEPAADGDDVRFVTTELPRGGQAAAVEPPPLSGAEWQEAGVAYRQVLSLILAQRRPSYHLTDPQGRQALIRLTDQHIQLLESEGVIPEDLARAALAARPELHMLPPPRPPVPFVERKAANAVRTQLLGLLGVPRLYDLDRMDLSVRTTIDEDAQREVTDFVTRLQDPAFVAQRGLNAYRLLDWGDPAQVVYSVALHERTPQGNVVRIEVDNLDAPFNLNESARLELGSTAKLRTLASYLEIIAEVHEQMEGLSPDSLRAFPVAAQDRLTLWVRNQMLAEPELELYALLQRAMQRPYSASPAERFVTGGGVQTFSNFDATHNHQVISALEGFRHSVNLVFVRMMRDVVNHYMYRVPGSTAYVLEERDSPLRQEYLERFADREGIQFLNQFIPKFRDKDRSEIIQALLGDRRLAPQRIAWAYRTAVPDATEEEFEWVLRTHQPEAAFSEAAVADLWRRADPADHPLADLGFLASIHPLELWAARYLIENPTATRSEMIEASAEARQDVYRWLFRTRFTSAQDRRIRSLLELEAFTEVLKGWQRLGYPFQNIVPSLGTSIGSSGDRPASLNELVGIILNDGVRRPTYRVEELHFARGTPYETRMERRGATGEQAMAPEVARVLREAMVDVVEHGTGRRTRGAVRTPDGEYLPVGAKTGTGDNRYRVFAPGGRLVESRSVNRTSTIVFFVGDRYYGVITAYVPGEQADAYRFTSALPAQILRELGPAIEGLIREDWPAEDDVDLATLGG